MPTTFSFEAIIARQVAISAPDSILVTGEPPCLRERNGSVVPMSETLLTAADIETIIRSLAGEEGLAEFHEKKELECAVERESLGRFRATFYETSRGPAAVFRHIPTAIPTPDVLGIPRTIQRLALRPDGLILVTGPNGHGKSTTLASLVDYINTNREAHIVTIEDPIEFTYARKKSLISQRAVGLNTKSFPIAIRHTLRQSVDVIVIGEMRDLETIATALTLAETGHLVIATLHTHDAARTVQRVVDVFPAEQQAQIALQFSHALTAIVSQRLIPRRDGTGRVCAREILIANDGIRHAIRERKISELYSQVQINRAQGMVMFDDHLLTLVREGLITSEQALYEAHDPKLFQQRLVELAAV